MTGFQIVGSGMVAWSMHLCLTTRLSRVVQALESIVSDGRLLMMVLVQALFEGSMLAFIVVWVPALKQSTVTAVLVFVYLLRHALLAQCKSVVCFQNNVILVMVKFVRVVRVVGLSSFWRGIHGVAVLHVPGGNHSKAGRNSIAASYGIVTTAVWRFSVWYCTFSTKVLYTQHSRYDLFLFLSLLLVRLTHNKIAFSISRCLLS